MHKFAYGRRGALHAPAGGCKPPLQYAFHRKSVLESSGFRVDIPPPGEIDTETPYVRAMSDKAYKKWRVHVDAPDKHYKVVLVAHVMRDGHMTKLSVVKGSGSETFDQSALDAMRAASPFAPLPFPNLPSDGIDIQMTFGGGVTSAISSSWDQPPVLLAKGRTFLQANDNEKAMARFKEAVELDPSMSVAHYYLGYALAKLGRTEEGIEEETIALALKPDSEETWIMLGELCQAAGQLDKTRTTYQEFLQRFPKSRSAPWIADVVGELRVEDSYMRASRDPARGKLIGTEPDIGIDYYEQTIRLRARRWPAKKMPFRVYIHPGAGVPGYKHQWEQILSDCFREWSTGSAGIIQFTFVPSIEESDIDCVWTNDASVMASRVREGQTRIVSDREGISRCTIQLLTKPILVDVPLTDNEIRFVCLHEIGHALGLRHTWNPSDVMCFCSSLKDESRELSMRDRNTIVRLYSTATDNR